MPMQCKYHLWNWNQNCSVGIKQNSNGHKVRMKSADRFLCCSVSSTSMSTVTDVTMTQATTVSPDLPLILGSGRRNVQHRPHVQVLPEVFLIL